MRLVVIFGPPAVGKMTVGRALAERTGLRLFHNHMSIEPVLGIFEFGSPPFGRLVESIREMVFREVVASDLPGLIYTGMWALDSPRDLAWTERVAAFFEDEGHPVHFVELYADLDERLRRNRTPERLTEKASKRDVDASEARLLANEERYKLNTDGEGDFFRPDDHLRIDNTDLAPGDAAEAIIRRFGIPRAGTAGTG